MNSKNNNITRICLWSGPRNISTALMYSFAQREDTLVFDEPLYGYYLKNTKAKEYHPGAKDILDSLDNNGENVVNKMMHEDRKPVLFFKNMTHHLLDLNRDFMKNVVNVILTRHPKEMIPSFAKVIISPTIQDIGYADHSNLLDFFEKEAITPIVLDSTKLLLNPENTLRKLCEKAQIQFYDSMLQWQAGARPEDGIWAKYWYDNVHKSTGFSKYKPKTEPFPEYLKPLLQECLPHYNRLLPYAIG
ncbi:sulfotransferase family protein [Corallibacter sp.]|uniref:sulfotransferase-like domain-containing protein n=1 Tax=Corallibacter sp. TaxID=2038084 RepID=UPI003A8FF2A5